MSSSVNEPSFRESVEIMYNRAVQLMDLPDGLKEKIRVCNATYTVRFGVRLRGDIHTYHWISVGSFRTYGACEGRYSLLIGCEPRRS